MNRYIVSSLGNDSLVTNPEIARNGVKAREEVRLTLNGIVVVVCHVQIVREGVWVAGIASLPGRVVVVSVEC